MSSHRLIDNVICAIVNVCENNVKNSALCYFIKSVDKNWNLCPYQISYSKDELELINQYIKSKSNYFDDKGLFSIDIANLIGDSPKSNDPALKLAIAAKNFLDKLESYNEKSNLAYKLIGDLHYLILKTSLILTSNENIYINVLITEVINKKDQLISTRRPLDLTRTSLIMSDTIMFLSSRLDSLLKDGSEMLSLWSILRPHPLTNPYYKIGDSYNKEKILSSIGGFNPATLVALVFSREPLDSSSVAKSVRNVLYKEYWVRIINELLSNINDIKPDENIALRDYIKYGEILKKDLPIQYIVTIKSYRVDKIGLSDRSIEKIIQEAFKSHSMANTTKYLEIDFDYSVMLDNSKIKGNPLCSNCYSRFAIVFNKESKPILLRIETSRYKIKTSLRARERLCPYHSLLRLEVYNKIKSDSENIESLFLESLRSGYPLKSVYGVASFYFRIFLFLIHSFLKNHTESKDKNIISINCFIKNIEDILSERIDLQSSMDYLLSLEQSLEFPCKELDTSSINICNIPHITEANKTIDYLREETLKFHKLVAALAVHYPELLYPHRLRLYGKYYDDIAQKLERLYRILTRYAPKLLFANKDCLKKILSLSSIRLEPSNYYALLYVDADDASKLFSGETEGLSKSIEASLSLVRREIQSESLSRALVSGIPFYVGGDDIIVMVPPEDSFKVAAGFYRIIRNAGLTASMAIIFSHVRIPLRHSIRTLFESIEASKNVYLDGRNTKNSITIGRITGTGKVDTSTLPMLIFNNSPKQLSNYFTALSLVNWAFSKYSLRRAFRRAIEDASAGGYRIKTSYYELSKTIENILEYNSRSRKFEISPETFKLLLDTLDLSSGLVYKGGYDFSKLHGFEELLKASLIALEPDILGNSFLDDWTRVIT